MIYLYSEDNKGGLHLINLLNEIYFNNQFTTESLHGIYKLGRKIENIIRTTDKNDKVIIIYDDSPGNTEVKNELDIAYEIIEKTKTDNIYFIPIICMEYEILSTYGIKTFANKKIHPLIDDLSNYRNKANALKNHLKTDIRYEIYQNRVKAKIQRKYASRCKKLNVNTPLTKRELDKRTTMDSICKEIMADGFQNELAIDIADSLGKCWLDLCCIKKNKICNIRDINIADEQIKGIDKKRFLMYFSRYHKVAIKISEISKVNIRKINNSDVEKIIRFTKTNLELENILL